MARSQAYKLFRLSDRCAVAEFGNVISVKINEVVRHLAMNLEQEPFRGFVECVPAYSSAAVFYDPVTVRRHTDQPHTAYELVCAELERRITSLPQASENDRAPKRIPFSFEPDLAPDLQFVADCSGLSKDEVIEIFLSRVYRVYMLGFLPGFAYMGELDPRIATPRREVPRTSVKKGSVGIAGSQTGVYPFESPGGWQIIGRTTLPMFEAESGKLAALRPGDLVTFVA